MGVRKWLAVTTACLTLAINASPSATVTAAEQGKFPVYRSPFDLAFAPEGTLALSDRTAGALGMIERASDRGNDRVVREIKVGEQPGGVVWSVDGQFAYVAEGMAGTVAEIDRAGRIVRRLKVGPRPVGVAVAPRRGWLLSADTAANAVSVVQLADGREKTRINVPCMPYFLAVASDEDLAVVGNRLPAGDASDPAVSAVVSLIDLRSLCVAADIRLPSNSTNVCGVAVSSDGRWAYVVHNLARAMLTTEQIEYGWINANAMTVIDLPKRRRYATVLLDRFNGGAANPFGTAISPDGSTLWVTLSGTHQLGKVDLARLHVLLAKELPEVAADTNSDDRGKPNTARGSMGYSDTWRIGLEDPTSVELVVSDLPVEYGQGRYLGGVFVRADLPGNGPRSVAVSPDGREVAVAMYYSGTVVLVDSASLKTRRVVAVGSQPPADEARRGEMIFHDADYCFEQWLSCSTCHPDGRADGLNWDLMNDGIGNPKNTRSLVLSDRTPPAMSRGVRPDMPTAASAGFEFLLFQEPEADALRAVEAYLRSLGPERSPWLVDGRLGREARRGKAIFDSPEVGCGRCHPGPLYTDLRMHDVGTGAAADESGRFDTPTLVDLWRTGPYLHHGRAAGLREVLTTMNPDDRHGKTSHLSDDEIDALIEYLRSL